MHVFTERLKGLFKYLEFSLQHLYTKSLLRLQDLILISCTPELFSETH